MFAPAFAAISGIRRYRGIVSQISFQTPCPKTPGSPNFHVDGQTINSHLVSATQAAADIQSAGAISRSDTDAIGMVLFP
jgi:hypothetical protein